MDEEYDVIVLGTGLTECILSGLLSVDGKKVLHMDRNDYYGGESASLNLTQIYKKYRKEESFPETLGRDRDYNIDLVPKFIMATGELAKILVHTDVTRYLEFQQISGSYVYRNGKISKVPSTPAEAFSSPLMSFFEKFRAKSFFEYIQKYDENNKATWQNYDLKTATMAELYKYFGLEEGTQDFIGHALALHMDDSYKTQPAWETYKRILLYNTSISRYGKSPYIYPKYGLGELPQGFARLSAIYGGTYMLEKKIDEIVYENGVVVGVKSDGEIAKCKAVLGDPSYFPNKVKKVGQVVRAICLLKHPIPNTANEDSLQIIIPQNQVKRKNDIYVAVVSSSHNICAKDFYLAIVSTIVETSNPEEEIKPALALLGPITEKFVSVSDVTEPIDDGKKDNAFVSRAYDATSHFESVCTDVQDLYRRITGKEMVLKERKEEEAHE